MSLGVASCAGSYDPPPAVNSASGVPSDVVDLKAYHGEVVYIDFWASWCPPCRESFPWMQDLTQRYAGQGLNVIAVNLDRDRAAAEQFLNGRQIEFEIVYDREQRLVSAYAIDGLPVSFLYGRDGTLRGVWLGFNDRDAKQVQSTIEELLKEGS